MSRLNKVCTNSAILASDTCDSLASSSLGVHWLHTIFSDVTFPVVGHFSASPIMDRWLLMNRGHMTIIQGCLTCSPASHSQRNRGKAGGVKLLVTPTRHTGEGSAMYNAGRCCPSQKSKGKHFHVTNGAANAKSLITLSVLVFGDTSWYLRKSASPLPLKPFLECPFSRPLTAASSKCILNF